MPHHTTHVSTYVSLCTSCSRKCAFVCKCICACTCAFMQMYMWGCMLLCVTPCVRVCACMCCVFLWHVCMSGHTCTVCVHASVHVRMCGGMPVCAIHGSVCVRSPEESQPGVWHGGRVEAESGWGVLGPGLAGRAPGVGGSALGVLGWCDAGRAWVISKRGHISGAGQESAGAVITSPAALRQALSLHRYELPPDEMKNGPAGGRGRWAARSAASPAVPLAARSRLVNPV